MKKIKYIAKKIGSALKILARRNMRELTLRRLKAHASIRARALLAPAPQKLIIGSRPVGEDASIFTVAEIGVNHDGDLEKAKRLMEAAKAAGADAVKFQKRDLYACYRRDVVDHPEKYEQSFQYLIPILKKCEFGEKEYRDLKEHARKLGLLMFATPFDEPSVDFLERVISPPLYKIASADLTNTPLLERLVRTGKPMLLSAGLSTLDEIDETAAWLSRRRANFILLHCQSTYPAPVESLNLQMIKIFRKRYQVPIGYSGHESGIDHTLAAVALGACVIERHITFDKNAPGPDHAASLTPEEFTSLVQKIRAFEIAYGAKRERVVKGFSRGEIANRPTLRKSLVAVSAIKKGEVVTRDKLTAKSPGTGLSPQRIYDIAGYHARRDMAADEMFTEFDLGGESKEGSEEKLPDFGTRWGLKARYGEIKNFLEWQPRPKLLEFHVSDKDLEFDTAVWDKILNENRDKSGHADKFPFELYLHAPEYYKEDLIDLGSLDERLWQQSIKIIQRAIDQARMIKKYFAGDAAPKIIIHVGGYSLNRHDNPRALYERAIKAFGLLKTEGVELLPENMPSLAWFFGGRWHCNNFIDAEEMLEFCRRTKTRMCFDTSHAWLACADSHSNIPKTLPQTRKDYLDFVKKVAPITAHLQIADAMGAKQKEGVQIHRGEIPFDETFKILAENVPNGGRDLSWVTEIWQGHLNNYKEFKVAFVELAKYGFLKPSK